MQVGLFLLIEVKRVHGTNLFYLEKNFQLSFFIKMCVLGRLGGFVG